MVLSVDDVSNETNNFLIGDTWRCKRKADSQSVFIRFSLITFAVLLACAFLACIIQMGINEITNEAIKGNIFAVILTTVFFLIFVICMNKYNVTYNWLRVKSGKNRRKFAFLLFNSQFAICVLTLWFGKYIKNVLTISYVVIVLLSFVVYDSKSYPKFCKADIYMQDGSVIKGVNVNKLYKNRKWFIVGDGINEEKRILQNQVTRIDYYNDVKIS